MVLADLGARVIKVEVPEHGDDARQIGPWMDEQSAYFMSLNRGKESIALNLKCSADQEVFNRLLNRADVLIENYRAGTLGRLGYSWEILHESHPQLIYAAVSGFGQTGPYASRPAYDMVVQGMGGIVSLTGQPDSPPTRVGSSVGDITAGLFTTIGVCAALKEREQSGVGRMIDVGMLDCQVAILENAIARYITTGDVPGPLGARHPTITPFDAFATRDGHMIIAAGNDSLFQKLCDAIGRHDLISDERFATNPTRTENVHELKCELETTLKTRASSEWLPQLEDAGVPCGPINNIQEVIEDPQVLARNMIVDVIGTDGFRVAGNPIKFSGVSDPTERGAVPALDSGRAKILKELGDGLD
tara:strand:- start:125 stop:1204 length:1080 start_codon:yes stop_codon:yes gene_type:complete